MNKVIVSDGQNLLDLTIQELGDVGAAFDLADANGLAVTDMLTPGQLLTVPDSMLSLPTVAAYFAARGQRINTGTPLEVPPAPRTMIDFLPTDFSKTDFT